MRAAVAAVALAALLALNVPAGQAADECKGLQVCIPVAGPWVAIPAGGAPVSATWMLVCPEGVVGGIDANVSESAVAVAFPGRIGSPVNPGITTDKTIVFQGTYAGRARRRTSYQPFIGCIPASGGGSRTPTALVPRKDIKPGQPITVRSVTMHVDEGRLVRATLTCRPGERLLRSSHSVGLFTPTVPTRAQLGAVHVVRVRRGGKVLVSATRSGALDPTIRADVQVLAECAR